MCFQDELKTSGLSLCAGDSCQKALAEAEGQPTVEQPSSSSTPALQNSSEEFCQRLAEIEKKHEEQITDLKEQVQASEERITKLQQQLSKMQNTITTLLK